MANIYDKIQFDKDGNIFINHEKFKYTNSLPLHIDYDTRQNLLKYRIFFIIGMILSVLILLGAIIILYIFI